MRGFQKLVKVPIMDATQNTIIVMYALLRVTTRLYLSRSNSARSLSTLIAVRVSRDTEHKIYPVIYNFPQLRTGKYSIFHPQQISNKKLAAALQCNQRRGQLLLGCDKGVWTADEVKMPCVGQLGSECSPERQLWTKRYLPLKGRLTLDVLLRYILPSNTILELYSDYYRE